MHTRKLTRRDALLKTGLLTGAALALAHSGAAQSVAAPKPADRSAAFRFSLNTATIRGQKVGIVKEVEIASEAGYTGIEPWIDTLQQYVSSGGSLKDLRQRIADAGLTVEGAIGFPEWIVDDDARRAQGLERARRELELVAQLGGKRFAAPPAGATDLPKLDLLKAAERYRALLEVGDEIGVVPQLELWGFSKNLNRLGECVCVAVESGHPKACVLADVYHLHKGGSDYHGMALLAAATLQVFHLNDFPAEPPPDKIDDSHRVYPGDGTGPLPDMLRTLRNTGGMKVLSLELFNREYWKQDPLEVAKVGLAKMKAVAAKSV